MDLGHRDARVIVTGGGANIGRGITLGFAAEGARVLVADIDGPQAEAVAAQASRAGAADDLTDPDAAAAVASQAVSAWGGVDSAFGAIRQGIYGSTKAGLISLARTVARENGRHGIRSNVVAPGLVLPDDDAPPGPHSVWAQGRDAIFTEEQADYVLRQQPLRRPTTSADVANAVLWISSPLAARKVTGQVVAVGGGSAMP
jgi:2-hydroxycyclohexanecarboxyl-CoA dehydrogenase